MSVFKSKAEKSQSQSQSGDFYTAFEKEKLLFRGLLPEIVLKIKKRIGGASNTDILIFSNSTGKVIDFDFHGGERDVSRRLEIFVTEQNPKENSGPGRPKLGVISREVSLLPRHWEWLAAQSGGASGTLRRLVDEARKKSSNENPVKIAQERTYKCMSVLAGDSKGYEEALRALYKRDEKTFHLQIVDWPKDVKSHLLELSKPVWIRSA